MSWSHNEHERKEAEAHQRGTPRLEWIDHIEKLPDGRGKTLSEVKRLAQDRIIIIRRRTTTTKTTTLTTWFNFTYTGKQNSPKNKQHVYKDI